MAKNRLQEGNFVGQHALTDIQGERVAIPNSQQLVHLQFRRFAGCPICDLHLHSVVQRRRELEDASIREVVVFHSTKNELLRFARELPFAVIADPEKSLYRKFGVESGADALLDPRAWGAIARGVLRSLWRVLTRQQPLPQLKPRGGSFGLPADFLIGREGQMLACKYGVHAFDQWSVDEILALAAARGDVRPVHSEPTCHYLAAVEGGGQHAH